MLVLIPPPLGPQPLPISFYPCAPELLSSDSKKWSLANNIMKLPLLGKDFISAPLNDDRSCIY